MEDFIFIKKHENQYHKVIVNDITHIVANKDYMIIYLHNQDTFKVLMRFNKIYDIFKNHSFLKINRGVIINTKYISMYNNKTKQILLNNTHRLKISKPHSKIFNHLIMN